MKESRWVTHIVHKAFNLSILERKRLQWVDYLRGIAILLVVYRHVLIGIARSHIVIPVPLVNANMIFYSFRMPLFFILSGIFINRSLAKISPGQLIRIKFEKLLYPYLIWTFLQISLQIIFSKYANSARGLTDYSYIFYQPRSLDQFWYLPALFNTTLIYVILKSKWKFSPLTQVMIGLVFYFFSPYFQNISMISDWMQLYIFFALGDLASALFFRESSQRSFSNPYSLLLMMPAFVLSQIYYLHLHLNDGFIPDNVIIGSGQYYLTTIINQADFLWIALIGCFTMILLAFRLQALNILSFLRVIGFHSLYIYVMHVLITAFVRQILIRIFHISQPVALLTIGIITGVTVPIIIYNLLIHDNMGWFLFSYKKRRPGAAKENIKGVVQPADTAY